MDQALPALRREEKAALRLRALFERYGYTIFRMGSFEEYDLYMQNKPFLMGDDIITFTAADGRLMALKPDVTLSIVKNTKPGQLRRVYYNENVYRRSRQTGEYREISQTGIEYIGGEGLQAEAEVLAIAAESLALVGDCALDISHMEFIETLLAPFGGGDARQKALQALRAKSPHQMRALAVEVGLADDYADLAVQFAALAGPCHDVLPKAFAMAQQLPAAQSALRELQQLCEGLQGFAGKVDVRIDFSILNDVDYYNGLIFQGFMEGVPDAILSGGRYDNLLHRFGKQQGAVGFALSLDMLVRETDTRVDGAGEAHADEREWLNVALPKGRLGNQVYKLFEQAGYGCAGLLDKTRKLIFEDAGNRVRYFLVKPSDVDIYVEHGAADIGVVGKDVLLESGADVLELLDLQLGVCRLAVAGPNGFTEDPVRPLRVATKYPTVARVYYASQSRTVEIIGLHGSIELAPLLGLSDVIVDIVETGATLKENGLAVLADIEASSARLVANRAAWRFKDGSIRRLVDKLEELL